MPQQDSSLVQCTTQRVYSKRDLFKTLTSMNIARDHHNMSYIDLLSYKGNLRALYACSHKWRGHFKE